MNKCIYDIVNDKYEICYKEELDGVFGRGVILKHKKSGARVCLVQNDDINKVFLIGFRTPPSDSTGVAHIIEHTVLCGSKKYPVKDPFIELAKGSLNTFLNAMTFPDRTLYPVASCNDKDIKNLSDVYMDAVFNPNIYKYQEIFRQEGWRYELNSPDDDITINGVVYNEMKGAYSTPEDVLEYKTMQAMFPDVTYGFSSGGDPDVIPSLTYGQFLDFHRKYYHPSNSYIYLYGNYDFEERLDWIATEYLDNYDYEYIDSEIGLQPAQNGIKYVTDSYSVTDDEDTENRTYLSFNAVMGDVLDVKRGLAWDILTYVLLTAPGAPVKQALLDAGIGKDIWGDYENYLRQSYFGIYAKDTEASKLDGFETVIRKTLEEQIDNGINSDALLGAINIMEFSYIEGDTGSYPKGLIQAFNIFTTWLYDDEAAFAQCHKKKLFSELREEIKNGYFEKLIREDILDNKNVVIHTLKPECGLNVRKEKELAKKLADYKASLCSEEILRLAADTLSLKEYQETDDTPLQKATLPVLHVSDVNREAVKLNTVEKKCGSHTVLFHEENTGGISYIKLLFDIEDIKEEYLPYVSLLANVLSKRLNTGNRTVSELNTLINIYTGGLGVSYRSNAVYNNPERIRLHFMIESKVFPENTEKLFEIISEIINDSVFDDVKRIKEILGERVSNMEAELTNAGHKTAISRAKSYFSHLERMNQLLHGIDNFRFSKELFENFDERSAETVKILKELAGSIMTADRLLLDITSDIKGLELLSENVAEFMPAIDKKCVDETFFSKEKKPFEADAKNEALKISGQIQYVAVAGSFTDAGVKYNGAFEVAKTILAYDYLWTNVRVLGGAYGCVFELSELGDTCGFVSYRDPNLSETYEVFKRSADYFRNLSLTDEEVEKYIIGTISRKDVPLSPSALGNLALGAYLAEVPYSPLQKERDEILATDIEAVRSVAPLLEAVAGSGFVCTVGCETALEKNRDLFKTITKF